MTSEQFVQEIDSFNQWLMTSNISASARLLWYTLMYFQYLHGDGNIYMTLIELTAYSGLSYSRVQRARKILEDAGRIKIIHGEGSKSATYQIIYFNK